MRSLIVVPAYNEESSLPSTLASLQAVPEWFDILVVNDGSTDSTGKVAESFAASSPRTVHVVHLVDNCGIGAAVQTGFVFAAQTQRYRYVVQFDADGQHEAEFVQKLVQECERRGLDLCIGSRFLASDEGGFRSTRIRRIGIQFFCRLVAVLTGTRVTDPTSGLRCSGPRAWRAFANRYPDDYPEPESLFWCLRNRLSIAEIPVRMAARRGGVTSIGCLSSGYYMAKVTLAILFDRLRRREFPAT